MYFGGIWGVNDELNKFPLLSPLQTSAKWKRTTVEVSRHSLQASVIALLAASSSVVMQSCAAPQDTDYSTIGAAVASMWVNTSDTCMNKTAL